MVVSDEIAEELYQIVNQMLEPHGKSISGPTENEFADHTPIDVSSPIEHQSKAALNLDLETLNKVVKTIDQLNALLIDDKLLKEQEHKEMLRRLALFVDEELLARHELSKTKLASDVAITAALQSGGLLTSLKLLYKVRAVLKERQEQLQQQKTKFWTDHGARTNHHARAIAFRLAHLFAFVTKEKPTYGIASDGSGPSTAYTRALEAIFDLLEIESGFISPAKFAVSSLKSEHFTTPIIQKSSKRYSNPAPRLSVIDALSSIQSERDLY